MSQGCALLILRSKGQRSRSWRMVIWKWFPDDNWLCNQPMIMKLHTLTPHEFVGVGGGPVLLQQYFQYAFICCPYMLPLLFKRLQIWNFPSFSLWYNVKFYTVLTPKMIWELLNCGSFLDTIYLRLYENVLKISLKIVYRRIWAY